eukprot:1052287-Rhodomonas_salina.1
MLGDLGDIRERGGGEGREMGFALLSLAPHAQLPDPDELLSEFRRVCVSVGSARSVMARHDPRSELTLETEFALETAFSQRKCSCDEGGGWLG